LQSFQKHYGRQRKSPKKKKKKKKKKIQEAQKSGMMVLTYNLSTWEAEEGG
jgi:hypothetical protein